MDSRSSIKPPKMFPVYRIDTAAIQIEEFTIEGIETWRFCLDKEFKTDEEARQYVREKNMDNRNLQRLLIKTADFDEKFAIVNEFSFDDKYLEVRRYMIGEDGLEEKIKTCIRDHGIKIEE
jgi:hypothetical protein